MQVSIITALFNRLDLTRACLASLPPTVRGWDYEWILIDDGSTDGTREFLRSLPDDGRIRVVYNEAPRGFAANNNLGARLARAPLLCLLNNDTSLLPGWLEPMARLARLLPDVALVGNVQREPFTGLVDHCGIYFDHAGQALHGGKDRHAPPREAYLQWPAVTAACCVVRRKVFLDLGGFDGTFRNGYEDVDFCLRAGVRGYRHFVANRSAIYHHISASPGRKLHEERNFQIFRERWGERLRTDLRHPRTVSGRRQEGQRYLRKHRWRPWRYNLRRFLQAWKDARATEPASRELELAPRVFFEWQDRFRRRRSQFAAQGHSASDFTNPEMTNPPVFMVVDGTVRHGGQGGIATVVRCLAGAFGRLRAPVRLVMWQPAARCLCLLPPDLSVGLDAETLRADGTAGGETGAASGASLYDASAGAWDDPAAGATALHGLPPEVAPPDGSWILLPEPMYRQNAALLLAYVRSHRWRLAVIFYDAMPTNEPQFFSPGLPGEHDTFMRTLSGADLLLPTSKFAEADLWRFLSAKQLPEPAMQVHSLGADTFTRTRATLSPPRDPGTSAPVRMLCVSTVEPRKNHRTLLAAYALAVAARPEFDLELVLVGARSFDVESVAVVNAALDRYPGKVKWYESADHGTLRALYEACDFTVFPSELESDGLPILESLWFGRPCICADFGAMMETAAGGGCLTVDVRNPQTLASAIFSLVNSPGRLHALAAEAVGRPLQTWEQYAARLLAQLPAAEIRPASGSNEPSLR